MADRVQGGRLAARAFGDPREVMKAAELLTTAERPAVVAGSGIWWDGAWKQLDAFAANGRLPVYLNGSGRGALPPEHELFFQHSRGAALAAADVVCVIGTPLDFRLGFGRFGVGPPYALGVKTAAPAKQVVVVAGDGAFGLNGFEYDTLARFELPTVFVIGNDAGWGEIRIPQIGIYGAESEVATRLAPTPYHRLTDVFGGHAEHVERAAELAPALERALAADTPAIVNVMLDPDAMVGHPYRGM